MSILTPEEVAEIKARADAASPEPWDTLQEYRVVSGLDHPLDLLEVDRPLDCPSAEFRRKVDAEFVAHARTDIPALIATVKELRESEQRLREHVSELWVLLSDLIPDDESDHLSDAELFAFGKAMLKRIGHLMSPVAKDKYSPEALNHIIDVVRRA